MILRQTCRLIARATGKGHRKIITRNFRMSSDRSAPSDVKKPFEEKYFECAANGNIEELLFLLKATVQVDSRNDKGWTGLMFAARNGQIKVIDTLLEKGCDVNIVNKTGQTAQDIALFWDQTDSAQVLTNYIRKQNPDAQLRNYFSLNTLDRCADKRKDEEWLKQTMRKDTTQFILFDNLKPFVLTNHDITKSWTYTLARVALKDIEFHLPSSKFIVFLGTETESACTTEEKGNALFAIDVNGVEQSRFNDSLPEVTCVPAMPGTLLLEPSEAGIFAEARTLLDWLDRYKFCATCGSSTTVKEGGYKLSCNNSDCRSNKGIHNTCYPRSDPSVIMLVTSPDGKRCLLGRKKQFPPKMYSCLAGFMEPGETLEDTVRREVLEESGIKVSKVDYHSSQPWPFPCSLMLGCIAQAVSENIKVDEDEMEDVQWFRRPELVQMLTRQHPKGLYVPPEQAIAHQIIKAWVRMTANL